MTDELSLFRGEAGQLLARETIEELGAHSIPTSPANYELWTAHRTGLNPDLSREIAERMARGEAFTDETNQALLERYIANARLSVRMLEAGEGIARELAEVVSSLRDAGAQAGGYASELQTATARLDSELDPSDFRAVVARLAATTRQMVTHNRQLEQRMEASSRQVEALQETLQQVRVEARTDGLTGLANRKSFDREIERRVNEETNLKSGLCLLMCDIDHFKKVNDTWGHAIGDQIIRFVASVLKHHAKGEFLAARYGGEEFAVIMPATDLAAARQLGASICHAVSAKKLMRKSTGESLGIVTVSTGIALHRERESVRALIERADKCLYHAKRTGRNRVVTEADALSAAA